MKHWQWGHPDDWSDAEWHDYTVGRHRRSYWAHVIVYTVGIAIAVYWLGVGF